MKTHEFQAPLNGGKGQLRRGAETLMQAHENRYMKCAGVAGLRARASSITTIDNKLSHCEST
jgi:hypothetical protein